MNTDGVFVQKTNHGGGSKFIRGLTGNQTLLFDGIRLNNSIYRYGPNQYLNTVDVFIIDRMEVAKGISSVQYGSDGLGGALQIFNIESLLNSTGSEWHGNVTGKIVSEGMEKTGRGQLEFNSKKIAMIIGGTTRDFGDLVGGKETGLQNPSGYTEYAIDVKLLFALKKNMQFMLAGQFLNQLHIPVYHKVVLENYAVNEFHPQQRLMNYARLNIQGRKKIFNQVKFIASWQQNTEITSAQKNSTILMQLDSNRVNTLGFVTDVTSAFSKIWLANSGVEYYHDNVSGGWFVTTTDNSAALLVKGGLYPDDSKYGSFSVYSLHHLTLNNWVIDIGIRFNAFNIKMDDKDLGEVKIAFEALVFNLGTMYSINLSNHLYGMVSNGFRAPISTIWKHWALSISDTKFRRTTLNPRNQSISKPVINSIIPKFQANIAGYYMDLNQLITRVEVEGEFVDGYQVY